MTNIERSIALLSSQECILSVTLSPRANDAHVGSEPLFNSIELTRPATRCRRMSGG